MSNHTKPLTDWRNTWGLDDGVDALQTGVTARTATEPADGYESNAHIALIYEDQAVQLRAVTSFLREGLDRGERCMYIVNENTREELLDALEDGGVDVATALDTGQLTVHSVAETYLEGGEFDVDEALTLLEDAKEEALAEYGGFRVSAEETWLLDDETAQTDFMTCEAHVNEMCDGVDCTALCQYNSAKLPPSVIEDAIATHPYLVYDGTVCKNFYYTPPAEYFGPDRPERDNRRKLETLVDRTEARAALHAQTRFQERLYDVVSQPERSFDEKLQTLFDLGCELFDMDIGAMARVDPDSDTFEIERTSGDHEYFQPGLELDLSETYCTAVTTDEGTASVSNPRQEGYGDITVRQEFGIQSYLGTYVELSHDVDRTLFFVASEPRDEPISEAERACHHLLGQWVQYELEHQHHKQELQRKNARLESFASMLAHELRNPLQIAQIYLKQVGGDDSDAVAEIERALARIEEMIDVLLITARTTDAEIDRDAVVLAEAARDVWEEAGVASAELVVETEQTVSVDAMHLWHLLENLFSNAVEHGSTSPRSQAHEDAVEHGSTSNRPSDDDAVEHGGACVTVRIGDLEDDEGFYVEDDGPGIPAEQREAVFEPGHTTATDGIGLGLTFVAQLAATYGWDSTVTESAAGGARFEFRDVDHPPSAN